MNKLFAKIAASLCAVALVAGAGVALANSGAKQVRAETDTFSFSDNYVSSSGSGTTQSHTWADSIVTIVQTQGSGSDAVGASYTTAPRWYTDHDITFTPASGVTITEMSFTTTRGSLSWSGSESSTFVVNPTAQVRPTSATITYTVSSAGTTYTVTDDVDHGTIDVSSVNEGATLTATITPDTGYNVPESVTVTMGGTTATHTYSAGVVTVANVSGDIVISGECPEKPFQPVVLLENIGSTFGSSLNTTVDTVDVNDGNSANVYTLNYYQCKKQGEGSVFMAKDVNSFVSNKTAIPGPIESIQLFVPSGASASAKYDVKFGTSEFTTATASGTSVNIAGGNDHTFLNTDGISEYFCITLDGSYNGQILKLVITYGEALISTAVYDNVNRTAAITFTMNEGNMNYYLYYRDTTDGTDFTDTKTIASPTWTVSNPAVAEINISSGDARIRVLSVGSTTITVTKEGYRPQTVTLTITELTTLSEMVIKDGSASSSLVFPYAPGEPDMYEVRAYDKSTDEQITSATLQFKVSDESVATVRKVSGVWKLTTLKPGTVNLTAYYVNNYHPVTSEIKVWEGWVEEIAVSGAMTKTAYTNNDSAWDPTGLIVTATYHYSYTADVTSEVTWTYNPAAPAEGVTSVVATATYNDGTDDYTASSAAQAVTVSVVHAGTEADPFTVAEGLAKCVESGTAGSGPWFVKGIISTVTEVNTTYGNATFRISDDGSTDNELICYRGKYIDNASYTTETAGQIRVGRIVVVTGTLMNYNGHTLEFAQGANHVVSITDPASGDISVTFEPTETSLEIGDTGTYTATSETSGVTFSWESGDTSVLTIDASTGEYEAIGLGVARVTVTATDGVKEGSTYADITVNGANLMTVDEVNAIAAALESGKTTPYYVYVEGFVSEFATSMSGSSPRAFDIGNKGETQSIMVYTGPGSYATFIDGLQLGSAIRVKGQIQNYNGTYEIVNPERTYSEYVAMTFAFEFLASTDAICENYDGVTDNSAAVEAIWGGFKTKYEGLTSVQQNTLINPNTYGAGDTVKNAMARYDYLAAKYGVENYIGRTLPVLAATPAPVTSGVDNSSSIIIVSIIALTSITSIAVLLIIKRRKTY